MPVLLHAIERVGRRVLRRQGFTSAYVETPLGKLHLYDARGSGTLPTTVLLHGLGATATPFAPTLSLLRRHTKRVVALDLPGHGFSKLGPGPLTVDRLVETVVSALDATLDEPAMVVGNSLGGALALHYAVSRPERVHSLALVSPAGARGTEQEWSEIKMLFDVRSRAQGRVFLGRLYHSAPWFVPLIAHTVKGSLQTPAVRAVLASAGNEAVPTPEVLGALSMPVLLLWGQSERILPESHFEYFTRHLPAHTVVERPEGFGHCPHLEAPRALVRRIVAFGQTQMS